MASEKWWDNDGYGNQAVRCSISLSTSDDTATSVKIKATGGADTYNSTGWGGSYINFAGHTESGGCYGCSDNYYWAHSSWWWENLHVDTITKTHSSQSITKTCSFIYGRWPGVTLTASATITVGAKTSYSVTYALDGGSGTFGDQTKWYDESLTLNSNAPTKTGFLFKGWTGSDGNTYQPGGNYTGNSALTLTAIWQAQTTELENVADIEAGENPSFSWTPQTASLTYKINLSLGTWTHTIDNITPNTTSRYTYNYYTVPMDVCEQIPDQVLGLMTAELETYNEGTKTGSSTVQFTVSVPASVVPTFLTGGASLYPDNGLHIYLKNTSQVKGIMQLTAAYASPIVEAKMTIGEDVKTTVPVQDPLITEKYTAQIISDVLPTSGSVPVVFEITDARGRKKTQSVTINVYDYTKPTASVSVRRVSSNVVEATLNMSYCEVGSNSATYSLNGSSPSAVVNNMQTVTQTMGPYWDSRNYNAELVVTDAVTSVTARASLRPGKGNRFETLSEDQFYVGMDDKGWKDISSQYDGGIDDGLIWFQREGYQSIAETDSVGIGMPVILDPDSDYELLYAVNGMEHTSALVSFFWIFDAGTPTETGYTYLSTTENLAPGDIFHTPTLEASVIPKILWGIVTLGVEPVAYSEMPSVYREFTNVTVRKVEEETERLDWEVETGNLGLDSPLHKYISKVVIRMAFEGWMSVGVSYDGSPFKEVYRKSTETLKSFDIPINVKRCDHFRFRICGKGVAKIYSIGYNEETGSEINEQP